MRQMLTFIVMIGVFFLSACSMGQPAPQSNQPVATQLVTPTSAASGLNELPLATGVPTEAPTVGPTAVPQITHTVVRGTIDDQVIIDGQVAPLQYDVSFGQDGILKRVFVQVGQQVKQGDLVAELELGDLETQLRQAQLTASQDQAQIARASQVGQLQVRQVQINVETERAKLEALKAPPSAVDITLAQTKLRQAQTALATTKNNASQAKNLAYAEMIDAQHALNEVRERYAEAVERAKRPPVGDIDGSKAQSQQDAVKDFQSQVRQAEDRLGRAVISFDTARNNEVAAVQEAEATIDVAQAELNALMAGPDPVAIAEQERVVRRAELAVTQAQQLAAPDPSLQRAAQSDRLAIGQIQSQIEDRRLYAPISGQVSTLSLAAGSPVQIGSPVVTLVDSAHVELVADATNALADGRTSLLRVSPGQAVQVTFSRYTGVTFAGAIARMPSASSTGSQNSDYHISFDTQNHNFSVGDLGQITIALGRKYEALWLPPSAVHITPDRTYVLVPQGGTTRRVDVVTGIVTATQVEILRGVQEGDAAVDQ